MLNRPPRIYAIISLLFAGLLVACGAPEDFQESPDDAAPGREDLIGRLQSPEESDELRSFRMRTETTFTGSLFPHVKTSGAQSGTVTVEADVTLDPQAMHMRTSAPALAGEGETDELQMIVIGDRFWINGGDGWEEPDPALDSSRSDLFGDLFESLAEPDNLVGVLRESPETAELLQTAEIVGTEEINGRRTTHFYMSTESNLSLLMARYEEPVEGTDGDTCGDLESMRGETRDLGDGEEMHAFFECMATALIGEMPPPDDYIERLEVNLWISDDGFVMREHTALEMAYVPLMALLGEDQRSPMAMETTVDLFDLNGDFEITPPEVE